MKVYTLKTTVSEYRALKDQYGNWEILARRNTSGEDGEWHFVDFEGIVEIGDPEHGDRLTIRRSNPEARFSGETYLTTHIVAVIPLSERGVVPEATEPIVDSIDITPRDEGYVQIAKTSVSSVLLDVRYNRQQPVREQLGQVLTVVGYLAQHGRPDLAKQVIDFVEGK
jgi:hypothetical protein